MHDVFSSLVVTRIANDGWIARTQRSEEARLPDLTLADIGGSHLGG